MWYDSIFYASKPCQPSLSPHTNISYLDLLSEFSERRWGPGVGLLITFGSLSLFLIFWLQGKGRIEFSSLCFQVSTLVPENMKTDLTVPICFVFLLHLANEKVFYFVENYRFYIRFYLLNQVKSYIGVTRACAVARIFHVAAKQEKVTGIPPKKVLGFPEKGSHRGLPGGIVGDTHRHSCLQTVTLTITWHTLTSPTDEYSCGHTALLSQKYWHGVKPARILYIHKLCLLMVCWVPVCKGLSWWSKAGAVNRQK